jgi:DNA-directed RNA polymerase subunit RPC12/RpoP
MALIKCLECGKDVSDKAAACPGCGAPLLSAAGARVTADKTPVRVVRAGWRWEAIGALLVIGGLITAIAGAGGFGWFVLIIGFVIFVIGRFIN